LIRLLKVLVEPVRPMLYVESNIETDTSNRMSIASLFMIYEAWVKENKTQCLTKSKFSRELKILKFKAYQTVKERGCHAKINVPK
jgi:hypothetical protein